MRETTIKINNLNFAYKKNNFVIENINWEFYKSSINGITGTSGKGKSTLIDLILGFHEPSNGEIKIMGSKPKSFIIDNPGKIGYCAQKVEIIPDTIRSNILLGLDSKKYSDKKIWEVIANVELIDEFEKNALNLDSKIGENSLNLSGGQLQRLNLARALIGDPEIIILDEITSSLDSNNVDKIFNHISKIKADKTIIWVTHDESLKSKFDYVLEI